MPQKKDDGDDTPSEPPEGKTIIVSTTDPECGVFRKGEHRSASRTRPTQSAKSAGM